MRALRAAQTTLSDLYDVGVDHDVRDFWIDAEHAERASPGARARREALLVREDADGLAVGLFVAPDALAALDEGGDPWSDGRFDDACLVTEGVSHWLYVLRRATAGDAVSALELELQAEVDKWAAALLHGALQGAGDPPARVPREAAMSAETTAVDGAGRIEAAPAWLAGHGVALVRARDALAARCARVRRRLFQDAAFADPAGTEAGDRYRTATRLAAGLTETLGARLRASGDVRELIAALRRFYRLGGRAKIEAAARATA
jgi:hypothetical protein